MKKRTIMNVTGIFAIIILTGLMMLTPAALGAQDASSQEKNWEFNLAPFYLWAMSMDGDLTVMRNTVPLQADFKEITNSLEGLFTVHFEGMHNSGWGFLTDVAYLNVGGQDTTPGPLPLTLDVDFTTVMVELAGVYRFSLDDNALDLIGGIRYYGLDTEIDVVNAPPRIDKDKDWVDAMLGARYIWTITDKWNFIARGDIGFGGSDLAWNLAGLFNYQPWKHVSLLFGYRYMDIDYDDGSGADLFRYDVSMHGPLLGVNFVW
ncbi:outer membrane protein [Thermodesulfobacteriota bacterium]